MAFEDMDMGNAFYCVKGCVAYNMCTKRALSTNENIEDYTYNSKEIK